MNLENSELIFYGIIDNKHPLEGSPVYKMGDNFVLFGEVLSDEEWLELEPHIKTAETITKNRVLVAPKLIKVIERPNDKKRTLEILFFLGWFVVGILSYYYIFLQVPLTNLFGK